MIIKECDEDCCFQNGNNNGNEVDFVEPITDAASCQYECQKNSECHAWTYNPDTQICYVQSTSTDAGGCSSCKRGPKFCPGGTHVGWHRDACNAKSYFICQKSKNFDSLKKKIYANKK